MADYQTIIDAIDAAILNWVGEPVTVMRNGRTITYRTLDELIRARNLYVRLAAGTTNNRGVKISYLKNGGPR